MTQPEPDTEAEVSEYVRRKAKIQLGDGPDQRGEITVETVDAIAGRPQREASLNRSFADWALEVERATESLRDQLGLDTEEGGA